MSRKLALIIGNSEYEDQSLAKLVTPGTDANALAEVLRDPEIGGFDEVAALVNQPAASIRRAVSSFFVGRGRDDLLLLYFSGHGIRDDRGQLFLAVKDSEHNLLRGTAIPAAFITEEMDNSRSRRQVLILDCCHSGAFAHGMKGAPGASVGTAAAFEGTGSGRVVLTATDSTQYAWEGDRVIGQAEHSVFTHYLIQGLRTGEADSDADGRITLDELYTYVYEQVVHETPKQTPGKWSYGQQGEMVIARNPRPVLKPAELPPDLLQTIDDPRPWVREGAVYELERLLRGGHPGLAFAAQAALKRLRDDDSRRVATAAGQALAAYEQAQPAAQATPASDMAPARAEELAPQESEEERLASEEAAAERQSHQRAEQERQIRARDAAERVERQQLARQGPAQEKAETGWKAAGAAGAEAGQQLTTVLRAVVPDVLGWPVWLTTIGWTIAWAIGWVVSEAYDWQGNNFATTWIILNAIGGMFTGLALRRAGLSVHWKHMLMIVLGWIIAVVMGGVISLEVYGATNVPINGAIRGAIGGLVTGLALRQTEPSIHWKQILIISIGWTTGGALDNHIGKILYDALAEAIGGSIGWWAIPGAITGIIFAGIGGVVMFWQLGQARHRTGSLTSR